jgi:uncharacterized protein
MTEQKDPLAVTFHEHSSPNLAGYTLIEGFPGMGLVGTIAAKYLEEKLNADMVAHLESAAFVPIIRVHNGYPVFPSRVYVSKKHKIVVLISEQVIPPLLSKKIADAVVAWIKKKKIKKVISLSGIRSVPKGQHKVYGIASNLASKKTLKKQGVEVIKDGITSGITALILLKLRDEKINAISLLGNVQVAADYKAAALLIEKLNEILGLKIDTKPLMQEAKQTEQALIKNLEQLKQAAQQDKKLEDRTVTGPQMYS